MPAADWIRRSRVGIPPVEQWRYPSFAALLAPAGDQELDERPLVVGADDQGPIGVSLADLRRVVSHAERWRRRHGYEPGDSVVLLRLPYSSEVPLAAAAIALMRLGIRVVLPMSYDRQTLADMAVATRARAVLRGMGETEAYQRAERADAMIRGVAAEHDLDLHALDQLDWLRAPAQATSPEADPPSQAASDAAREVLVLSTSGSTGTPKLVRYSDRCLLGVAEAFHAAGLMDKDLQGGPSICPTLSHSMGFRNVLHAVWNRQPTLLVQPEWLEEKPKQFVKLLQRWPPHHITCGPALLRDLSLLAGSVERVRQALAGLQCVVSSGAADPGVVHRLPTGVTTANAFGMTELQQVMSTLVAPPAATPRALGSPLPGVVLAVDYSNDSDNEIAGEDLDRAEPIGRLRVAAPFKALGYVGQDDFGEWFDTGDLVRVVGDDLVWVSRAEQDILNTGHGAKAPLAELERRYQGLAGVAEAVLFVAIATRGGVGALIYLGDRDPEDHAVVSELLAAIAADHQAMADAGLDFALAYQAITVAGCVAGRPPRRGPGKIDRRQALSDQADLLAGMEDPALDHPRLFAVPPHGSDRPDWRAFAAGSS